MVSKYEVEDLLERLYWDFDAQCKEGSRSERDVFKGKMRFFALYVSEEGLEWLDELNGS